ncbi:MAG: hypothetical protein E6H06_16865 [Bacteroidetes bacterium]|nr:MAG: hypothetical protein E6H06_16865 [Bacteroidota bacterium]
MKKMIIALLLVMVTFGTTALAHGKEIDKNIQHIFNTQFAGAADVQWNIDAQFVEVDFTFNNMRLSAYYNNEGERLAVVRNVHFSLLPLTLQFDLKRNYKDYWITKISEVSTKDGTQYQATLESANRTVKLGSVDGYDWELMKREAK